MNWFKQHLNWTLFIGVIIVEIPLAVVIYGVEDISLPALFTTIGATLVAEFSLEIWYLHQKKRSYTYLLLNFLKPFYIPIGFFIMLGLANKREAVVATTQGSNE